jgi:hypothetical protein
MQPLHLDFKPSYRLASMLAGMGLMATVILIAMPILWPIKLSLSIFVIAAVIYAIAKYALLILPASMVMLTVNPQYKLEAALKSGVRLTDVGVCAETVVSPYLTVIRLQQKNAPWRKRVFKISVVVMPDSVDPASFRKLRTWLRWGTNSL